MNKKWIRSSFLISLLLAVSLIVPFTAFAEQTEANATQLNEMISLIEKYHISGITADQLRGNTVEGMLNKLNDPYTQYFSADDWNEFQDYLEQNYVGIGIRVGEDAGGIYVAEVFPSTPAEAAGLKTGDYIVQVDGISTTGSNTDELIDHIIGPENTSVTLTVKRDSTTSSITMMRNKINLPDVTGKWSEPGTGYIRMGTFSSEADEQFEQTLTEMKQKGIHSLVVDLRDNPGGLLDTATRIAELFIRNGTLINTVDRDQVVHPITISGGSSVSFPVVMLVNEYSASASEVLTGALQDYNIATVVGTKTFGKGSVQSIFYLSDGGMLKLTVEQYLTPKMRKVNHVGLTPNVEVEGNVPQLITALRTAGIDNPELAIGNHEIKINGIEFSDSCAIIRENNKIYVPSRVLAALIGAKVDWNESLQAVEISSGDAKRTFVAGSEYMKLEDGTSYIDVQYFHDAFGKLVWKTDKNQVLLSVEKVN